MSPPQILSSKRKDNNRKKVICPFSLCSSNCPILCYIISLGRLQAHMWGNIKTHFSLLLRPRILFQTRIFTLFWFPKEPFVFKIWHDACDTQYWLLSLGQSFHTTWEKMHPGFFAAWTNCFWFEFSFKAKLCPVRVTLLMFDSNQSVFVILPVKVAAYEIRT